MRKLLLVFWHEYIRRVKTKGFIFAVLSMPLILFLGIGLAIISARLQSNPLPIGYFDPAGFFAGAETESDGRNLIVPIVDVIAFDNVDEGTMALENEEIQALFIIPADFPESSNIEVQAFDPPGENAYSRFRGFIRAHLIKSADLETTARIERGSDFTVIAYDGSRSANMQDWFVVLFPFLVGLIFIIVINITGGYLMQSVVDEKENRTMEMIVTSVSPEALMAGKILGNLCVGLTQLLIWLLFAAFGALSIAIVFDYGFVPVIMPIHLVLLFGVILPGFVLVAALMTLVGVTAASLREAQQVSILFTLPMVAPYWFAGAVLQNPNHPLSAIMSIFPLTAVITMPMRTSIGDVPDWQILLTVLLMVSSAILSLWLAARVFRASMLNYGKRTSLKGIFFSRKKRNVNG